MLEYDSVKSIDVRESAARCKNAKTTLDTDMKNGLI